MPPPNARVPVESSPFTLRMPDDIVKLLAPRLMVFTEATVWPVMAPVILTSLVASMPARPEPLAPMVARALVSVP